MDLLEAQGVKKRQKEEGKNKPLQSDAMEFQMCQAIQEEELGQVIMQPLAVKLCTDFSS